MDFARVLVVSIVLFGVLLVVFGGEFEIDPDPVEPDPNDYRFRPVEPEDAFFVGTVEDTDFVHRILTRTPFGVSFEERERLIADLDDVDVRRGLFRNQPHYLEFNLTSDEIDSIRSMDVEFDVAETNELNSLNMYFNDERFFSGYPEAGRSYSAELDTNLVEGNNVIEISADSSGWRFWAPTVYMLNNFRVRSEVLEEREREFTFELDKQQAEDFRMGRLVLRPEKFVPEEPIVVEVNDQEVFRERVSRDDTSLWIEFDDVDVHQGENSLRIFTYEGGSYGFRGASMVVFWYSTEVVRPVKYLDVSRSDYRRLPGKMTFHVDGIEGMPEYLSLRMTTADDEKRELMIEKPLKEGETVSIDITRDDLAVGENRLEFIVGGEGGYYLSDFQVRY